MRKWIPVLLVLAAVGASAAVYHTLPETIVIHWDLQGNPNGWSSRVVGAFAMPLVMVGVYAMMRFLPLVDPRRENYEKFQGTYEGLILTIMVFLLAIHIIVLRSAMGHPVAMQKVMPLSMGMLFIAIGNLLPRARSNFFVGIRTPWTLSSEKSWERTHRAGGYVFVLIGIMMAASVFMPIDMGWGVIGIISGIGVLGLIVYSYSVWKDDPNKRSMFSSR
jgi:uncharacterized membrane protein